MKLVYESLNFMSRLQRWVSTKAMSYHWHEFMLFMWPLLLPAWMGGLLVVALVFAVLGENNPIATVFVYPALILPIVWVTILRNRAMQTGKHAFDQFLKDNNLKPNKSYGFKIELDKNMNASFQRIVKPVAGKGETYYSAISINLGEPVPEIVLDANRNNRWLSSLPDYYGQNQHLHLEGNFNKYFDLYAPVKWRIEAMTIITPDIMQALLATGHKFDLEIIGGEAARLVISTPGYLGYEPDKLQALVDAFTTIYPEIQHKLKSLNIKPEGTRSLNLEHQKGVYTFTLLGGQVPLYKTMAFAWTAMGLIIGSLYLFGVRAYVEDMAVVYLGISMVLFFGYAKLKE